jgi:hypothetical protein
MQSLLGGLKTDKLFVKHPNTVVKEISGHTDLILTQKELRADTIILSGLADASFNLIFDANIVKTYTVFNASGQTVICKNLTSVGHTITNGAADLIINTGIDIVHVT